MPAQPLMSCSVLPSPRPVLGGLMLPSQDVANQGRIDVGIVLRAALLDGRHEVSRLVSHLRHPHLLDRHQQFPRQRPDVVVSERR